jgi:hypothetical protein
VLRVSADRLMWSGRGGGPVLDLTASGLRPTGVREPRGGDGGGQNELVLTAADAGGTAVRLVGLAGTVQNLHEVLSTRPAPAKAGPPAVLKPGGQRRGLLLLPAGVLAVGIVGGAFTFWALTTGVPVTGTALTEDDADGYCDVRWTDPRDGRERVNGVDCYYDVGDDVDLIALADPLRGEVVVSDDPWRWAVISGGLAVGAVGWGTWRFRARRREETAPVAAGTAIAPPPPVNESQLDYTTAVETMRARAAADGWAFNADAGTAAGESWVLASPRRAFAAALAFSLWPLLVATFFAVLVGWTPLAGMWSSLGETARATATVTAEPFEVFPFTPADLEVRFSLPDGSSQTTLVAVRGLPDVVPETLDVEYSVASPHRARALEHDGAPFGAALSGVVLAIGLGFAGWRLWNVLALRRAQGRALRQGKHLLRYVLTPTPDGTCLLLLYRDGLASSPAFAFELADDMLGRLPGAGTVEIHGLLVAGEVVVARTAGRQLVTASPLLDIDPDEAVHLINGTEPAAV